MGPAIKGFDSCLLSTPPPRAPHLSDVLVRALLNTNTDLSTAVLLLGKVALLRGGGQLQGSVMHCDR